MQILLSLLFIFNLKSYAMNLKINFIDLSSTKGNILYLLFNNADGFPDDEHKSLRQGTIKAAVASQGIVLEDLTPGTYALSVIHDENENGKLDTSFLGIPKEDFGFSNNPKIFFGPPGFDRASFELRRDLEINIKLRGI